jgi:hypothetical protein
MQVELLNRKRWKTRVERPCGVESYNAGMARTTILTNSTTTSPEPRLP